MTGVILGINLGHDRSACLVVDGVPRVAIAEERLSRIKHDIPWNARGQRYAQFPERAAAYCLDAVGLSFADVDLVVASTTYVLDADGRRRNLEADDVRWQCPALDGTRVETVPHHEAHAASAALCAGFRSAAVLIVDGGGSIVRYRDGLSAAFERTTAFRFRDGVLTPVIRVVGGPPAYGNSLGDLYQAITMYLGFRSGEEGKTMGLAGYRDMGGEPGAQERGWAPLEQFRDAIAVDPAGCHTVAPMFQFTADGDFHPALVEAFGPPRPVPTPDEPLDRHLAASAQWALEEAMLQLAAAAHRATGERRLCMAGGVALNCVANGRILREGPFEELFVQPAATDDGTALGNALLGVAMLSGHPPAWTFGSAYLGRDYRAEEVAAALAEATDEVRWTTPEDPAGALADDVAAGHIVALFRGGCEFGPRALGHRSILCDARQANMKDHLNHHVKHRESFRPFAPMVLADRAGDYFDLAAPSAYMLLAALVIDPAAVPAIVHVDGSARVQTVDRAQEPFLHEVLERFADRTGVPVLLNTSFNDSEPIVETPREALRCFLRTGIDVLHLDGRRVTKVRR